MANPIEIRSGLPVEPKGDNWRWCYVEQTYV